MWLKLDLNGIIFHFQIRYYQPAKYEIIHEQWCRISCSFIDKYEKFLNHQIVGKELLISAEVEEIADAIEKLLNDKFDDIETIEFIEPDFELVLYPKHDKSKDPKYSYVAPGYEIEDIHMDWKVFLWDEGLTDNYYSIRFYRNDLENLLTYLYFVMRKYKKDTPIIEEMINNGLMYG